MTLETSLENRKPARHALGIALRECAIPGVVVALLMGFLLAAPAAAISRNPYLAGRITYYYGEPDVAAVFPIVMALAGVVQGLFAFSLLFSRSASNTYFGLGLSRRQLFAARYAAGALWLAAAAVFATASGVLVNLVFISRSGLILGRGLYIGAGLLTTALIAYTLTAVVCSLSGTLGEGLLYSLLAALIPTLLLTGLGNQMNALLRGSPYGYSQMSDYVWDHNLPGNLFGEFTLLNPALFFYPYFAAYCAQVDGQAYRLDGAPPLSLAPILGWLAVTAVLVALARRIFVARRVEKTGFAGACAPLGVSVLLPLAYAAFTVFLPLYRRQSWPLSAALAAGAALSAGVYCALAFPLRLAGRPLWRGLLPVPALLAAALAVTGALLSGGFGYADYIPPAQDIGSIEISYKGMPGLVPGDSYHGGYLPILNDNGQLVLTDAGDIALAMDLHRVLIRDEAVGGTPGDTAISNYTKIEYTLKDGRTVLRFYRSATLETLGRMLALDETEAFAEAVAACLDGPADTSDETGFTISPFRSGTLYLSAPLSAQALRLGEDAVTLVRQALLDDLKSQQYEERYFPAAGDAYVLYFIQEHGPSEIAHAERIDTTSMNQLSALVAPLYVDTSYPETLRVLESLAQQPESSQIEWAKLSLPYTDLLGRYTMNPDISPFFCGFTLSLVSMDYYEREYALTPVDDPARAEALFAASRGFYFAGDGGRMLFAKLRGSDTIVVRYVPAASMPD